MGEDGADIRRRRLALGWQVRQLAAAAGIHRHTVRRVETGAGGAPWTVGRILRALNDAETAQAARGGAA